MSIIKSVAISFCISVLIASSAHSNPTSKEYVDNTVMTLRNDFASNNAHVLSLIDQLNARLAALTSQSAETGANLGSKIVVVQNQINELPIITHKIGDIFQGGMVFYVDASQQHGLIASLADASKNRVEWRNGEGGDRRVNAQAQGLGAGETNTRLIVAEQTVDEQEGQFAALMAANYQVTESGSPCLPTLSVTTPCYGGWYLPSAFELMLLYTNLKQSGLSDFGEEAYWSSTETSATEAWLLDFGSGQSASSDKSTLAHVRAIHNF